MFHDIPPAIAERMQYLERLDARHRRSEQPHFDRLRQIPPATGRFLALLAAGAPEGSYVELGTSGGYSTLWLSLAAIATGRKIVTFEMSLAKADLARETFRAAGIEHLVDLVFGDARTALPRYKDIGFCFMDVEKEHYVECYDLVVPRLVAGGLLVADNVISHRDAAKPMLLKALGDPRVDAMIVPVGSGELVCRKA